MGIYTLFGGKMARFSPGKYYFTIVIRPNLKQTMQTGTVKFFNETKGFGFIKPDEGGEDIFVHASGLIDQIRENDKVKFNVERGKKGLNAVNVEIA
jgi:CspA family cold shock protein